MRQKLKQIKKRFGYLCRRHFLNQIFTGKGQKVLHYFKIYIKNKFFGCPRLAMIETGTTCNLNCPTCPTPRSMVNRPPNMMKIEDYKKIIDSIKNYVHVALLYYTNEPLLHPRIGEMIKYADINNLFTSISTNAMLLDRKKTDEILNSGLDEILLCLDGLTKEAYEPFRIGANFKTVINNIKYFCKEKKRRNLRKPYIELQFLVTKLNQDQIPLIENFTKKYGIDRLRIKSLAIGKYAFSESQRQELAEKFLPTAKDAKTRYKKNKDSLEHKNIVKQCGNAKNQIVILDKGQLTMCCYDVKGEYIYGNLLNSTFSDIWFDSEIRRKHEMARQRKHILCKRCDIF